MIRFSSFTVRNVEAPRLEDKMYCGGLRSSMASSAASCYEVGGGVAGGGHLSVHHHHHQGAPGSIAAHCPQSAGVIDMDCWTNGVGQLQMASMVVSRSLVVVVSFASSICCLEVYGKPISFKALCLSSNIKLKHVRGEFIISDHTIQARKTALTYLLTNLKIFKYMPINKRFD